MAGPKIISRTQIAVTGMARNIYSEGNTTEYHLDDLNVCVPVVLDR